ncbi:uncharacterized protein [Typha latifolia]|uniref:uncharacterized protein n=1 Tax=Typha latifolia TaxID=4733 RepID=UPI003C2E92FF
MEAIWNAAATIHPSLHLVHSIIPSRRTLVPRRIVCLGFKGQEMNIFEEPHSPSEREVEMNDSDIWKLFTDAQQNILYLNKQRLTAMEEVKKIQRENEMLLERVKQLEEGKQVGEDEAGTKSTHNGSTTPSSFCELLLRIDSMVVSGMVGTREASDLRKKVMDNRIMMHNAFYGIHHKTDMELLSELRQFSEKMIGKALHIVHICSEMEPIASCGTLASYVTGLSCALQRKGNLVEVILPKYASINLDTVQGLRKLETEFDSYFAGQWHKNRVWIGVINGIGLTLVEPLYYSTFFNRERLYGYADDFERFAYFSRASMDYLVKSGKQPDILHIHNWETAIVGPLFWDIFVHQGLHATRVLLSCHDLSMQCLEQPSKLELCGLDPHRLHRIDRLQDNDKAHLVNILKGGIVYSNKVIMMSSTDSRDRLIHSLSHGLEPTLGTHKEKLMVAPYGFDGEKWDPFKDNYLPRNYSAYNIEGKAVCKVALAHRLGLSQRSSILVGCISGFSDVTMDYLKASVQNGITKSAQFIFMEPKMPVTNSTLKAFQNDLRDVEIRFVHKYDEALAHLICAGSDIILCPSFHDPLSQIVLKAIKYGSAPISMKLTNDGFRQFKMNQYGGSSQNESVRQSEWHDYGSTMASQYILSTYGNMSLSQAFDEIRNDPLHWAWRIKDGMLKDFSWDAECFDIHWAAYTFVKNL